MVQSLTSEKDHSYSAWVEAHLKAAKSSRNGGFPVAKLVTAHHELYAC